MDIIRSHPRELLSGLNELRASKQFCDVVLVVGNAEFDCHKNVLAAFSPYFKAMFSCGLAESSQKEITITTFGEDVMKVLIDFAYTGRIDINTKNVFELVPASDFFQLTSLREACCTFLERNLNVANCIETLVCAETHSSTDLLAEARKFILRYYNEIIKRNEYLNLSMNTLIDLISDNDLIVPNEETVFQSIYNWLHHDFKERSPVFADVLKHVKLPLIRNDYLEKHVIWKPDIIASESCKKLLEESRKLMHTKMIHKRRKYGVWRNIVVGVMPKDNYAHVRAYDPRTAFCMDLCLVKHLPEAPAVITEQNYMYIYGSRIATNKKYNTFDMYDPLVDMWMPRTATEGFRQMCGLALLDGYIYVVGGVKMSSLLSTVERYDPATDSWMSVANMNEGICEPAVIGHNGYLYVAGGCRSTQNYGTNKVRRYCPKTNIWCEVASLSTPRFGSEICSVKNEIYLIGGWDAKNDECTNMVECYDPSQDKWQIVAPMMEERQKFTTVVIDGRIFSLWGLNDDFRHLLSIEIYDPSKDEWHEYCGNSYNAINFEKAKYHKTLKQFCIGLPL